MINETEVWQPPTAELAFPSDHIDIWLVRVDSDELPEPDLQRILAGDEAARAGRFHFANDRGRYIRGRAALRILLGRYLATPPGEIRFQYGNHGKPAIAPPHDIRGLRFNVSNSGGLALIAVGCGSEIGVDIEKVREMPDLLSVARRFFSARELQAILSVSAHRRQEAFFTCWTRKEAFLKATGSGLSYPLSGFSVSVNPQAAAELWEIEGNFDLDRQWFLTDVFPGDGFRGALARQGDPCHVAQLAFDPSWAERLNNFG